MEKLPKKGTMVKLKPPHAHAGRVGIVVSKTPIPSRPESSLVRLTDPDFRCFARLNEMEPFTPSP